MKWNVGTKIGLGYGLALIILISIGAIALRSTMRLTATANWVEHTHEVIAELSGLLQALTDAETAQRGFAISSDERFLAPYEVAIPTVDRFVQHVRTLTKDNPQQQERLDTLEPLVRERVATMRSILDIQNTQGPEAARKIIAQGDAKKQMDGIRQLVGMMTDQEQQLLNVRAEESEASAQLATRSIIGGTIVAILVLAVAGVLITRNISVPLREITSTAERISQGDLNVEISAMKRTDEVGLLARRFQEMVQSFRAMAGVAQKIADGDLRGKVQVRSEKDLLGNAFASMVENLRSLTSQMVEGINVLSSSANQISTSTTQLAASAAETATAVSQTTATVEEVRQTAELSSNKAKQVSEAAQRTAQISQTGIKSTEETSTGMTRIRTQMSSIADSMVRLSEQGQMIGQIVAAVEDLASQSNLLAVNASIEAAKAGEQGRGFGVVAQEVRSLAEQSKQATNQVRSILGDIQKATGTAAMATEQGGKAVEVGVLQATQAGQSIQSLAGSVTEAANVATQIAASSQQQLIGVDQVASAMENIKQASTQNLASAKQLEAAAHDLKELGHRLKVTVERYKV